MRPGGTSIGFGSPRHPPGARAPTRTRPRAPNPLPRWAGSPSSQRQSTTTVRTVRAYAEGLPAGPPNTWGLRSAAQGEYNASMRRRLLVAGGLLLALGGTALCAGGAYAYYWDNVHADRI